MATQLTAREEVIKLIGRLHGLCGTVRYDLPDEYRAELHGVVDTLEEWVMQLPH